MDDDGYGDSDDDGDGSDDGSDAMTDGEGDDDDGSAESSGDEADQEPREDGDGGDLPELQNDEIGEEAPSEEEEENEENGEDDEQQQDQEQEQPGQEETDGRAEDDAPKAPPEQAHRPEDKVYGVEQEGEGQENASEMERSEPAGADAADAAQQRERAAGGDDDDAAELGEHRPQDASEARAPQRMPQHLPLPQPQPFERPEDARQRRKLRKLQQAQAPHQSRKLVEFAKAERLLKKQFDESNAEYTRTELRHNYTAILDSVFTTYFRILKRAPTSPLLPVALSGVARHCRQINVDFMADIIRAIEDIMLRTPGLPPHIPFHCARTALLALKAQGYYTDVDLTDFFTAVYKALVGTVLYTSSACIALHRAAVPTALTTGAAEITSHDILAVALDALELLLVAPKQLPLDRVAAFVKRICAVPLLCLPAQAAAGFLCVVAKLVRKYPRLQNLLAGEQGVGATGTYMPYLDMPDHTNPWSTALWELPFLQTAPLYQPYLHRLVAQVLAGAAPEMLDAPSSSELAMMLKRDALWDGVLPPAELTTPSAPAAATALAPKNNKVPNKTLARDVAAALQHAADTVEAAAQHDAPFVAMFDSITKYKKQVADAMKQQKQQQGAQRGVGAVAHSS